ncbi:hypothetical protein M8J75_016603 [Diaphorina citri]|nr:hypothetical protein M8J75_016603 [Diaphorina citri]
MTIEELVCRYQRNNIQPLTPNSLSSTIFGLDLIRSTIKHYHVAAAHCSAIYTYLQYNQLISASKCQPVLLLRFGLSLIRLWV